MSGHRRTGLLRLAIAGFVFWIVPWFIIVTLASDELAKQVKERQFWRTKWLKENAIGHVAETTQVLSDSIEKICEAAEEWKSLAVQIAVYVPVAAIVLFSIVVWVVRGFKPAAVK